MHKKQNIVFYALFFYMFAVHKYKICTKLLIYTKDMDFKELKKQLPPGAITEIAKRAGVTFSTMQRFINGIKTKNDISLLQEITQYLKEFKDAKATAVQELEEVLRA